MVHFDEGDFEVDAETIYNEYYYADDQSWDDATLKQLREEYGIYFMTSGDGVIPVKVYNNGSSVALGSEDDGTISFQKWGYGAYVQSFSTAWIEPLIADLRAAKNSVL